MGRWSIFEDKKYLEFLIANRQLFELNQNRRKVRVFKKLAAKIPRRNPEQCRSHHLKLARTCGNNIDRIIGYVQEKIKAPENKNLSSVKE